MFRNKIGKRNLTFVFLCNALKGVIYFLILIIQCGLALFYIKVVEVVLVLYHIIIVLKEFTDTSYHFIYFDDAVYCELLFVKVFCIDRYIS